MEEQPTLLIYKEQVFTVGQDTFIDSTAENNNAVVFEDNEETGYFYAVDRNEKMRVLDALHIYNVADVTDKEKPSTIKILWTVNMMQVFLSINNYYHAVFDFKERAGYCRSGFPNPKSDWTIISNRILTDELIERLAENQLL